MDNKNQIEDFFNLKRDKKDKSPVSKLSKGWFEKIKESIPTKKQIAYLPHVFSKKERYFFIALVMVLIASVLYIPFSIYFRATTVVADNGGSYKEGIVGEPRFINPLLSQSSDADRDLSRLIYSGLMKYNSKGELIPDLAKSYEISNDGLSYTFILKEDLFWHDGENLEVDDILFTIETAQDPDYGSSQRINWQGVNVRKVNEQIIKFTLKNKYAQFLNNMTLGIIPRHIWGNIKPINFSLSEFNLKPIGSGPYMFNKLKKNSLGQVKKYEVKAFEKFHDSRSYINTIEFSFFISEDEMIQAYNRNEIQGLSFITSNNISDLKFRQKLNINPIPIPRYFSVFFNQNQSSVLSDKNVRLALNYGTDRNEFVEKILDNHGIAIYSPILPNILDIGETVQKYRFDLEFAQEILSNSGWIKQDSDDFRKRGDDELIIELTTLDWPESTKAAQLIQSQWEDVGVKVDLRILSIPELQQVIKDRNYEALLFGEVININPDPFSFWHSSQKNDPGLNLALYDNDVADNLLEEARQTLDPIQRAKKYDDFQKVFLEDAPVVFLYSPYYIYAPDKKIRNTEIEIISIPSNRFDNINSWYIETRRVGK